MAITNLTLCTPSALSCIGMLVRAWKKENSLRHAKTWQLLRKTTRRLASRLQRVKAKRKATATSSDELTLRTDRAPIWVRVFAKRWQAFSLQCVLIIIGLRVLTRTR